jgi:membrane fusion protein, multidrug efflux system
MRTHPVLALALCVSVPVSGCRRTAEPAPATNLAAPAVNVRVAAIEISSDSPLIRVPAVLARQMEVQLSFPVAGILASVSVRAGDRVSLNQELARLQSDTTEAQVVQASAALEKAGRDLARIEKLRAERVTTLESVQDAKTLVEQASAALRIAEFNRRHSIIVAPADGIVLRRLAEPNEQVPAARPVLSFAGEADGWIAKAGLTARNAARIKPGATITLEFGADGRATGKIVRMAETIDPTTLTVFVEAALDSPPAGARSGLNGSLVITPPPVAPRPVIPLSALRDGRGGSASVFLVGSDSRAKRLVVDVEQIDGERVYLRTPVSKDAQVIIAGGQHVHDGGVVRISDAKPVAAR